MQWTNFCHLNWRLCLVIVLETVLLDLTSGFNVDLRTAVVQRGDQGSMFGFSVAQHIDQGKSWLYVGAPNAQTRQKKVIRGGGVYRCSIDVPNCQLVSFDDRGPNIKYNGSHYVDIERKSYQWFGATLHSSGKDGVLVACAPRYVYFSEALDKREPIGSCYVAMDSASRFQEFSPCRDTVNWRREQDQINDQGYSQLGWAAAINQDSNRLFMGGVGSWFWQGQVFSQDLNNIASFYETREGPTSLDNTLMGYSVAVGDFNDDGQQDVVTGIPKADDLKGRVAAFSQNLKSIANVTGEQMGEYFGYSVAAADFNGDGSDDVAVGAPFYSDYTADAFEIGRVYVHYQTKQNKFGKTGRTILSGPKIPQARFGLALAKLADINNDKFDDLAVGAPYAGKDRKGAVYIFHGSSKGIIPKLSQIIHAEDISSSLSTFGFSLSGGSDLDGNLYPDILVGAYNSDRAVYLRSRPVIRIKSDVTFVPQVINLDEKKCQLQDGTRVVCLTVKSCFSFVGLRTPNTIELDLQWTLDAVSNLTQRAFYLSGDAKSVSRNETITVRKRISSCKIAMAYIKNGIRDKLTPITADVQFAMPDKKNVTANQLTPILDQYTPRLVRIMAHVQKNCGPDNICIPDLTVRAKRITDYHVIGTNSIVEIHIHVENHAEGAFEAQVKIQLPPGVSYINVYRAKSKLPVKCQSVTREADSFVVCDIGNPLPASSQVAFALRVSPAQVNGTSKFLHFFCHVNSSNPENYTTIANNFATVKVPVKVITDIRLTGVSRPEQILYNLTAGSTTIVNEEDVGPEVIHLYEVRNLGPSATETVNVEIRWPSYLEMGQDLLYLTIVPRFIEGEGSCITRFVNPRNLTIDTNKKSSILSKEEASQLQHGSFRIKRQTASKQQIVSKRQTNYRSDRKLGCRDEEYCAVIRCDAKFLDKDDNAVIEIRSRLWTSTLIKNDYRGLIVVSDAVAHVMQVPYDIQPEEYSIDTFQVATFTSPRYVGPGRRPLELWVIALAVTGGCLLLFLLILALCRCGFFKRHRVKDLEKKKLTKDEGNNGRAQHHDYASIEDQDF